MSNNPELELDTEEATEVLEDSETGTTEEAEVDAPEVEVEAEIEGEAEEAEELEETSADDLVYEIDGEEVTLADLRKLREDAKETKEAGMRQADYTKKSQANAERAKALNEGLAMLEDMQKEITALALAEFDGVDMDELRDTDTAEFLRVKDAKESKSKVLDNLKAKHEELQQKVITEQSKELHERLGWSDAEKRDSDVKAIQGYVAEKGIDQGAFARVADAGIMQAILDAAKYQDLQNKKPEVAKKVKAAPKLVKPVKKAAKPKEQPKARWQHFYAPKTG